MILDFKATVFFGKPYLEMSGEKPSRDGRNNNEFSLTMIK